VDRAAHILTGSNSYVHGARVVLPPIVVRDGPHSEHVLRVLDFSIRPTRVSPEYDLSCDTDEESDYDTACGPSSEPAASPARTGSPVPDFGPPFLGTPPPGTVPPAAVLPARSASPDEVCAAARYTPLAVPTIEDAECRVFRAPVASALPCAVLERQARAYRYTAFMLDGARLIGLKSSPFTSGDMKDVDVFTF
jgi:hypothetical protein